jgi:hypothetical protein
MRLYRFAFGIYAEADELYTLALIPARSDSEAFDRGCALMPGDPYRRYTITHSASGARVGPHTYASMQDAEDALGRVAGLFEWSLPGVELRAEYDRRALQDAAFVERLIAALLPIRREGRPNAA